MLPLGGRGLQAVLNSAPCRRDCLESRPRLGPREPGRGPDAGDALVGIECI